MPDESAHQNSSRDVRLAQKRAELLHLRRSEKEDVRHILAVLNVTDEVNSLEREVELEDRAEEPAEEPEIVEEGDQGELTEEPEPEPLDDVTARFDDMFARLPEAVRSRARTKEKFDRRKKSVRMGRAGK